MSQKEVDYYNIISRLINREINGSDVANLLKLSTRQVRRLKAKVKQHGAKGLIHGNRGKSSNRQILDQEKQKIISLINEHYHDFGPTFACEKLFEVHKIDHDPKTIRQIMIDQGFWKPRKKKKEKEHRMWRERKANYGEMIQFDGSYEYWFEDRAPKCCLLASIDDATGKVTKAKFDKVAGVMPVFAFWQEYLEKQGKPRSVYLDKFSTYKMNQRFAKENHELKTQFERAMDQLRIETISANSPQAKGRVERLFLTLQDRLIKELRLNSISTIAEANIFLEKVFIPNFNAKFAVEPRGKANLHSKLIQREQEQLNSILSRQEQRVVQNDFTISFNKQWRQLIKEQPATICKKDKVIVEEWADGSIHVRLRGKDLNYEILPERPKKQTVQPWVIAATDKVPAMVESAKINV